MAEKILIMGESGTGKSTSIRNCDPNTTAIVNPVGKPLPFKGSKKFETLNGVTDSDEITKFMKNQASAGKKIIIVDDFQYILAIPYMDRIKETGWDKYNDFGANYFKIIEVCNELPEDVCVYYLTHCETLENGLTTVKLIGKLLREKITIEGLFTIVLKTAVVEGKYYFLTQNSGKDTVKSPMGMFDIFSVDNDLAYIDAKIRNYYEFDGAKSDAEIAKLDEEKSGEVEKPEPRRRRSANRLEEMPTNDGPKVDVEPNTGEVREDTHTSRRRGTRTHDEVVAENKEKIEEYLDTVDKAIAEAAGDNESVPLDDVKPVETPKLDPVPRRTVEEDKKEAPAEVEEQPKRRTRKARS